jgi:predicted membrane chloride channel (bestrophin family)
MRRVHTLRNPLLLNAAVSVAVVVALKLAAHWLGWEIISLNPLFSGIIAANVFLMGFLLSGVLADYKESERLPGELAASLEAMADEAATVYEFKKADVAKQLLDALLALSVSIKDWFHKKEHTRQVMATLGKLNHFLFGLEGVTQANFIARLKQEQSNIRRMLIRIHTIRETSFIPSGYVIADTTTFLLLIGLILSKIEPLFDSLFFVSVITFLMRFLGLLIKDCDNPFGYYDGGSVEDVSLKPIDDAIARLQEIQSHVNDGGAVHGQASASRDNQQGSFGPPIREAAQGTTLPLDSSTVPSHLQGN